MYNKDEFSKLSLLINHLLFADDCLIFVKAELRQLIALKKVLESYERVAGQKNNYDKSEFMCSGNLNHFMQTICGDLLNMRMVSVIAKYLGLPLSMDMSKRETFRWVEKKVQSKVLEWTTLFLSEAGKEALVKFCLQPYPIYAMSCFCFPSSL